MDAPPARHPLAVAYEELIREMQPGESSPDARARWLQATRLAEAVAAGGTCYDWRLGIGEEIVYARYELGAYLPAALPFRLQGTLYRAGQGPWCYDMPLSGLTVEQIAERLCSASGVHAEIARRYLPQMVPDPASVAAQKQAT